MRVLLLGANGLLGHNVLRKLLADGHEVAALVRRKDSLHADAYAGWERQLTLMEGSLLDYGTLLTAAQGCGAIINCAGVTDMSHLNYADYLPVNRDLCGSLVRLMEQTDIHTLVHTSTANTIGFGTAACHADEHAPMAAPFTNSYYACSKREGERLLQAAAARHSGWHIVIVNPGFMIGAFDTKPSSGTLLLSGYRLPVMAAPSGGKSFVHVADAAAAIAHALLQGENGARYLLTGENLTLRQFYALQAQVCGYRQRVITLPDGLARLAGRLGDLLRCCKIRTQLSTRNVSQLLVKEYYSNLSASQCLAMPHTPIAESIKDFFAYHNRHRRNAT